MATELSVVNDCLAVMGEAPVNAINEDHAFLAGALGVLNRVSSVIQARSWWYNMENLTVTANPDDGRLYLPNDVTTVLPSHSQSNLAKRGRVLYDLVRGTDVFEAGYSCTLLATRQLHIEDVPASVADYIAAQTVLEFQSLYDGDQTKTRNLQEVAASMRVIATSEHMRQRRVNFIDTNERLGRIRARIPSTYY